MTLDICISVLSEDIVLPSVDTSWGTTLVTTDDKVLIFAVLVAADDGMAADVLVYVEPAFVLVFEVGRLVLSASVDV